MSTRSKPTTVRNASILAAAVPLLALGAYGVWDQTRTYPTPRTTSIGYEPVEGDIVFQALPPNDLTRAIEGATGSSLSHCGVVALDRGRWVVIEALGTVRETPLEQWIGRGRLGYVLACRLDDRFRGDIPAFIAACRTYLGRPYDTRYRMDDEAIYCTELPYKAFRQVTEQQLGELVRLGDLRWQPYEQTIRKYEGGDPPLERLMITPRDMAEAEQLRVVFESGK
jgi:hypothetical protein